MKVLTKELDKTSYQLSVEGSHYPYVVVNHSSSNCKLSVIDYIGDFIDLDQPEESIEKLKAVLATCNILVHIHTTNHKLKLFICKHFEVYTSSQIPVGYEGGFQYHLFLRNTHSNADNTQYLRPLKTKEPK
jgi:hypothetical protein